jgi:hypothetical protein
MYSIIFFEITNNKISHCVLAWRPDANTFPSAVKGLQMDGWDEIWLDIRQLTTLQEIMGKRIALAKAKGCHGIEPDNVDCWSNDCVEGIEAEDENMGKAQIVYNKWLAAEAHRNDLSIGLKNNLAQISSLLNDFDWAINEQCFQYGECSKLSPFINAGKAVFNVEYSGAPSVFCAKAKINKFSSKYGKNGLWVDC